jgi:HSP20 family molecular chaperone IbpA
MPTDRTSHEVVVEATAQTERTMRAQRVPVNVYETTAALVVVSPLPAVTAADVTIELRPGSLRFWAHLRSAAPRDYLAHEWEYGGSSAKSRCPRGSAARWRHRWRTANSPSGSCEARPTG